MNHTNQIASLAICFASLLMTSCSEEQQKTRPSILTGQKAQLKADSLKQQWKKIKDYDSLYVYHSPATALVSAKYEVGPDTVSALVMAFYGNYGESPEDAEGLPYYDGPEKGKPFRFRNICRKYNLKSSVAGGIVTDYTLLTKKQEPELQ